MLAVAGICAALTLGAALALTPVVNQQLWTDGLIVPVLACALLPLYALVSLLPRRRHTSRSRGAS